MSKTEEGDIKNMILCRCFDCEEHAEEFLCGKIRMMSLEYYRKKEADENGRKDKYEGAQKIWQGEHTTVKIDDIEIPIIMEKDNSFKVFQASGYSYERGMFLDLY